jgi:hypothetical protein
LCGMAVRLSSFRRLGTVAGAALLVAALVIFWGLFVRTLRDATPVPAPHRTATTVVWGDRVFSSPAQLRRWLHSRGSSYSHWSTKHPQAVAVLEHKKLAVTVTTSRPQKTTSGTKRATSTVPRTRNVASGSQTGGSTWLLRLVTFALLGIAVACIYASLLPAALRLRYPAAARTIAPFREALFAAAVAVMVGLLISNVLN